MNSLSYLLQKLRFIVKIQNDGMSENEADSDTYLQVLFLFIPMYGICTRCFQSTYFRNSLYIIASFNSKDVILYHPVE